MNTTLYRDQRKRKRDWEKDVVRNASRILLLCVLLPMKLRLSLYTHNTFRNCYLYNENFCYCIAITIGQSSVSSRILTRSQLSIHFDVWWVTHSPLWLLFRWTMLILYTHFFPLAIPWLTQFNAWFVIKHQGNICHTYKKNSLFRNNVE